MRALKYGNNMQVQAERVQEYQFTSLMSHREERRVVESVPEFRVSVFEILKTHQPAAAWAMGVYAGWPEMQR